MSVHFMSQSVDWATPKGVYEALDAEFHFNDDPCPLYGASGEDGLAREWGGGNIRQPALWSSHWRVDRQGVRRSPQGQDGRDAHSKPYRHDLVA
jgi:hypothetical protein